MRADGNHCPICKNPNRCGVGEIRNCWCVRTFIPKGLLKLARDGSCICAECVKAYQKSPEEFTALNRTRPI